MYEVDFLKVESANGPGSKSGDAIAVHFNRDTTGEQMVVVIDAGFTDVGDDLADHIQKFYQTDYIDLVISTHPDADHINGIARLLERMRVRELLLHQPMLHYPDVSEFSNIEAIDNLLEVAKGRGVPVEEPFTGLTRFEGQLGVLGPTMPYYADLVQDHIDEVERSRAEAYTAASKSLLLARSLTDFATSYLPPETLDDEGDTGPRNNSSVITLLKLDNHRLLFTGDAGIPALTAAAAEYETQIGRFRIFPLHFVQVPHHGSRRNVGPTILNRILGEPSMPFRNDTVAFISSAEADEQHPSPKVVNAFSRRGCVVMASEGMNIRSYYNAPDRSGWSRIRPLPPLDETDDD